MLSLNIKAKDMQLMPLKSIFIFYYRMNGKIFKGQYLRVQYSKG